VEQPKADADLKKSVLADLIKRHQATQDQMTDFQKQASEARQSLETAQTSEVALEEDFKSEALQSLKQREADLNRKFY